MNKNRRRCYGFVVVAGSAVAAACSVDTSGITFVEDDRYNAITAGTVDVGSGETGAGGEPDAGGEPGTTGGVTSTGGAQNKGGKGGSSNGGSTTTAGRGGGSSPGGTGAGVSGMAGTGGGSNPGVCPVVKGDLTAPLIDDMDDGDAALPMGGGRVGGWYVSNDGTRGAVQKPLASMPPPPEMPGASGTKYAMHTSGYGFVDWGANIGIGLLNVIGRSQPCPYDVSRYTGVKFLVKGSVVLGDGTVGYLRFSLPTMETHAPAQGGTCDPAKQICGDHFGYYLLDLPPDKWAEYDVPFSRLGQKYLPMSGTPAMKFELTHVLNVQFELPVDSTFDIWIDDVEFY